MTAALKQATQLKIQMTVVKGPHAGHVFNFDKPVITLGRGPENDVVLVNDPMVSRSHARIDLIKNEFELKNLSEKNILLVHGDSVQKSILINDSTFQIGDSKVKFQFDLGQSVVSVPTTKPSTSAPLALVKPKPVPAVAKANSIPSAVALKNSSPTQFQQQQTFKTGAQQNNFQSYASAPPIKDNKKLIFYGVVVVIIAAAAIFILSPNKGKNSKAKPILKYEDEVAMSLASKPEAELRKKRDEDRKAKDSPTNQRAEENFIKGMRDFQLGNYARAQDFFQVVLNLIPDHPLARRHLYLSKVRFDELVQAKLVLGESYYQKHNFGMCLSMYQQVMNMLLGKSSDQKYQLAQRMAERCQLATEGIQ